MVWSHCLAWLFGALLLTNAVPHLVAGMMGSPFQSPFATPSGEGLSSSRVNVLWGWSNLIAGYLLLFHVGQFDLRNLNHAACVALPAVAGSLAHAWLFGRFHGGNDPTSQSHSSPRS